MRPKKFYRTKQPAKLRINTAATVFPENVSLFSDILSSKLGNCQELDTEDHWSHIRDTTHAAALKAFGKKEPKSPRLVQRKHHDFPASYRSKEECPAKLPA